MLSVSKQTQKVMTNSKDKEIIEETERYQEERPETQFKRKPSEDTNRNRRETETENEEKSCKKSGTKTANVKSVMKKLRNMNMKKNPVISVILKLTNII